MFQQKTSQLSTYQQCLGPTRTAFCVIFVFLFLSACDSTTESDQSQTPDDRVTEENSDVLLPAGDTGSELAATTIPWFQGSIEAAFTYAQAVDKPLFLYWGAIWCPL